MKPVHYVLILLGAIVLVGGAYLLLSDRNAQPVGGGATGGGGGGGGMNIAGAAGTIGQGAGTIVGSIVDLVNQSQTQQTAQAIRMAGR
jgi:hypothetical protein